MKTVTIRLPCVEAAMLAEVQKINKVLETCRVLLSAKSSRGIRRRQRAECLSKSIFHP